MSNVIGMGEAILVGVGDNVDPALRPSGDRLRNVLPRSGEAETPEQLLKAWRLHLVDSKFDKCCPARPGAGRQRVGQIRLRTAAGARLVQHEDQRAVPIDGDATSRAGAKLIVEDLER